MKKVLLAVVLGLAWTGAHAEAVLSCDEVDQLGEALTTIGVALEDEQMQIDAGSADHLGLAETCTGLAAVGGAEGNEELANTAVAMCEAWDNNDRDAFTDHLADAVVQLAQIHASECQ